MGKKYQFSPFGVAIHPWLTKADTKFSNGGAGTFKCNLRIDGEQATKFRVQIEEASQKAFDEYMEDPEKGGKLTAQQRKKWSVYYPFEVEEDDEGKPTGTVVFHFRQNAEITLKDKSKKAVFIAVFDATGKGRVAKPVYSGSILRMSYSERAIPMVSQMRVGIRLDFAAAQVKELATRESMGGGFGAVEGYSAEDDEDGAGPALPTDATSNAVGDY